MNNKILYQNKKIFYRSCGSGKSVLLVHGFGEDGKVWEKQQEILEDKFHLIIPDLPGSGQSEMISDMSMEGMAEVLHAIIHEENIDTCTMIGHSMGGYITLAFAEKYRNHLHAFGLFHSTAFADSEEKKAVRKKGIEFIRQHGAFEFLKTILPNLFSSASKSKNPDFINEYINRLVNFSTDALMAYYHAMLQRPDRTSVLKNTTVPVLFVAGEHDSAIPLEDGLKQCHLPGKTYFHILKQSAHMGMLEEPATTNCLLEKFLIET